jgi:hypothetical protein
VARSTTGGLPGRLLLALPGVVVMVSSAVSSRALAGSLRRLSTETTHGAETHRDPLRIEEPFGWIKTIAGGRQLRYRGRERDRAWFKITAAVYNLLRITTLDTQPA